MRVLVIGSGGREHALVWKLAQSPEAEKIYVAPGNGGTASIAQNVPIAADDIEALVEFAKAKAIDLVAPGPEGPLARGLTDAMEEAGVACFGPDKYCAQLEGSKSFAKRIMTEAGVPTASHETFTDPESAIAHIDAMPMPLVIKADGLAAGKGVIVARTREEAHKAVREMLEARIFGEAGARIVVEEFLEGEEASLLCLCDGKVARPMPSAQDHKAVFDNDEGPNTGGMGAYSPAPCLPDADLQKMADLVVNPALRQLAREGHPFRGVCYAGLMLTKSGPKVLEYNVRFGDPECQPLMLRMESDLLKHMRACVEGRLEGEEISYSPKTALGVVLTAKGYPGDYPRDLPITGVEEAEKRAKVFHGGTKMADGQLRSCGGRVLCVTALGEDLEAAQKKAYEALGQIHMPESHTRRDIGAKGISRLRMERN